MEPDCRIDDDCEEGEVCVTVGNFGVAECVEGKHQCTKILANMHVVVHTSTDIKPFQVVMIKNFF